MKKVSDDKSEYRNRVMGRKDINDEIQISISYIKDELQNTIKNNLLEPRKRENCFDFMVMD